MLHWSKLSLVQRITYIKAGILLQNQIFTIMLTSTFVAQIITILDFCCPQSINYDHTFDLSHFPSFIDAYPCGIFLRENQTIRWKMQLDYKTENEPSDNNYFKQFHFIDILWRCIKNFTIQYRPCVYLRK